MMDVSRALTVISKYCNDWYTIRPIASPEELGSLESAVNLWLVDIQRAMNSRTSNTLGLRCRTVTRSEVRGSIRSLAQRPQRDYRASNIEQSQHQEASLDIERGRLERSNDSLSDQDTLFVSNAAGDFSDQLMEDLNPMSELDPITVWRSIPTDENTASHVMTDTPGQGFVVESYAGSEIGSPNYFQEQMDALDRVEMDHLKDFWGDSPNGSNSLVTEVPRTECNGPDPIDRAIVDSLLRPVLEIGFRPLYPDSGRVMSSKELEDMLEPLLQGTLMTKPLIYNLLLTLLPMPLVLDPDIEEWTTNDEVDATLAKFEAYPDPLLMLADKVKRKVYKIGCSPVPAAYCDLFQEASLSMESKNPTDLDFEVEVTLGIVYLATISMGASIKLSNDREIRLEYIRALLGPYQSESVLRGLGIGQGPVPCRQFVSLRWNTNSPSMPHKDQLLQLINPNLKTVPEGIGKEILRILQCVYEVGSPTILESLKTAAAQPREILPTSGQAPSHLLRIHRYLDTKGLNNHLDVARTRYVKYCYFGSFQSAVDTLTLKKRQSRIERKRKSKRLATQTSKAGHTDNEATPETDWITFHYPNVEEHGSLHSDTIVRRTIVKGIQRQYGGNGETIEKDLNRYLQHGNLFHQMLQGADPALLILFPGEQYCTPTLSYLSLEDASLRESLKKPLKVKSIDALSDRQAKWFGEALRMLRPELFSIRAMPTAIDLLLGLSSDVDERLRDRIPQDYSGTPMDFLA